MPDHRDQSRPSIEAAIGNAQAIRENLARIDAMLPLVPLPVSQHEDEAGGVSWPSDVLDGSVGIDPPSISPPAPKRPLSPNGRIPLSRPHAPRRP